MEAQSKKKLIIGAGIAIAVIVIAGAVYAIWSMKSNQSDTSQQAATPAATPSVSPGQSGAQPGNRLNTNKAPGALTNPKVKALSTKPNATKKTTVVAVAPRAANKLAVGGKPGTIGKTGGVTTASNDNNFEGKYPPSILTTVHDPFKIPVPEISHKDKVRIARAFASEMIPPPYDIYVLAKDSGHRSIQPIQRLSSAYNRRLDGIVYNHGVHAILETNNDPQTVEAGSYIPGGRVIAIDPNSISIRDNDGRTTSIPLFSQDSGTPSNGIVDTTPPPASTTMPGELPPADPGSD